MPSVTYDGRSFLVDGRRIWLVSGSVPYARIPREQWADRLYAAKLTGVNTIETPVVWSRHEPIAGSFNFKGENDIRHFVELVHQLGMYCILRPGPFVGDSFDFGGLPPWLLQNPDIKLRTGGPGANQFLDACSKYITAVCDQVRTLQVSSSGKGGPIILLQSESAWTCGNEDLANIYLGELARYYREAGITVPVINANNMWAGVEGEIDCWTLNGSGERPLSTVRQLATVKSQQPRLIIELPTGPRGVWARQTETSPDAYALQRSIAEVMAGGAQFNLSPLHGGINFGFSAGRLPGAPDNFVITSEDRGAPLTDAGAAGASFGPVRRICTFASRFARVLANLDPSFRPIVLDPEDPPTGKGARAELAEGCSVIHAQGTQGSVVFVFARRTGAGAADQVTARARLMLPDGLSLPVELGVQSVVWCLFNTQLTNRAMLDYCNLSALAQVGSTFVCYGPTGAKGQLAINGSPLFVTVPKPGKTLVLEHEGVTVVVLPEDLIDSTYLADDAVYVGAAGLTRENKPIVAADGRSIQRIGADGVSSTLTATAKTVHVRTRASGKVSLGDWACAPCADYCDGSSARFASIAGPAELVKLGAPLGYGWYRLQMKSGSSGKVRVMAPHSGDRLHAFLDGEPLGILGVGHEASLELSIPLKKGEHMLTVLAENLGRFSGGAGLGDGKGLFGHFWEVEAVKPAKPVIERGAPVDPLSFKSPLWEVHTGDRTLADRVTWTIVHRKKEPMIFSIGPVPGRGLLLLNDAPIKFLERNATETMLIDAEKLSRGNNTLQVALLPDAASGADQSAYVEHAAHELAGALHCYEAVGNFSEKAQWAFAKWEPPAGSAYSAVSRGSGDPTHRPAWWRATLDVPAGVEPVYVDLAGMTKGQIYLNGKHLCRYFAGSSTGKAVPGQSRYLLPRPWLKAAGSGHNELVLFDEHRGNPSKVRVTVDHEHVPLGY